MLSNPGAYEADPGESTITVDARSPVAQRRRLSRVGNTVVALAETRVFVEGDSLALMPIAVELLRRPWGGAQGGWWNGASTTYVNAAPDPSADLAFAFDFRPLFFPAPAWARAIVGGAVGAAFWGPPGAALGAAAGVALIPGTLSPTLIRVSVGCGTPVPGGVQFPVELGLDFSGPAVLSVRTLPGGVELRSAWLAVTCNKPMPPAFSVWLHLWRERAVWLRAKAVCERRLAALGRELAGSALL